MEDKVSTDLFEHSLKKKLTLEEIKLYFEDKTLNPEAMHKLKNLQVRVDELTSNFENHKRSVVNKEEHLELYKSLNEKVDVNTFTEQLNTKACKQSLANALNRKVNKSELDLLLSNKADANELTKITHAMDQKVDSEEFKKIV